VSRALPRAGTIAHVPLIALVSTYPPRACGIATFSGSLFSSLRRLVPEHTSQQLPFVVAVVGPDETSNHPPETAYRLPAEDRAAYRHLASELDKAGVQVVSLQHEYGIFGGPSGAYVLDLLDGLRMPVVTTLHTVRSSPTSTERDVLHRIGDRSTRLVVMARRARDLLVTTYGVPGGKIVMVPHGVPDIEPDGSAAAKAALGLAGRRTILSFGLLGPGKNLELVVDALPGVAADVPDVTFVVLGATHPAIRRLDGETYREQLLARVAARGVADHVRLVDRFVSDGELRRWLAAADVFVTPYRNAEQIVSGTLSYALAAGTAIVSTPYEYAVELLADRRGVLVPFGDVGALGRELRSLLLDDELREGYRRRAYEHGRGMTWSAVAQRYVAIARELAPRPSYIWPLLHPRDRTPTPIPPVDRRHLERLTDDIGIHQHANGSEPDPVHGYCTDDVARALAVDQLHGRVLGRASTEAAIGRCLSFLEAALDPTTGRFRNFRHADGRWLERHGSEDCHGRAIAALGSLLEPATDLTIRRRADALLEEALPAVTGLRHPRPLAYTVLGCVAVARNQPISVAAEVLPVVAGGLAELLGANRPIDDPSWPWFESRVTYDNGVLPQALIAAGSSLGRDEWMERGLLLARWLIDAQTDRDGYLSPIGNRGWWRRGERPARFDQQPIEALSLLEAARVAYEATGDRSWLDDVERAFAWFGGANRTGIPLVDEATGGCRDGLGSEGPNRNQGAESTLAWLLAVERIRLLRGQDATVIGGPRAGATPGAGSL
jgi:glycosyltransferase involved in cell wall biosynthesis